MFTTKEINKKKIGLHILLLLISLMLLIVMIAGNVVHKEVVANADEYDFEIYFLLDGVSQVDLGEELESKVQYESFLLVEMYIKALSAPSYEVAVMEGSLYLDKTFFSLPEASFDTTVSTTTQQQTTPPFGTIEVPNWGDYWLVEYPGYDNLIRVGLQANTNLPGGNVVIDQSGLLLAQMWIEVDPQNLPTEPTEITWDFNDEYDPGKAAFAQYLGGIDYNHYCGMDENDAYLIDDSNILFTPLSLGDPAGSVPSAELSELSLKENQGGATEYIKESFNPLTTSYSTWQISYADSVNGMLLNYSKASNSADVTVTFSIGSSASIDENNVITGLADGDEIIIDVSDDGGLLQETYTIVTSVTAASDNADLSSLTAKSGTTPHSFEEIFDANTLSYTLNIPYRFTEVTLTATVDDPLSTVYIDTVAVASRTFSNLAVGTVTKDIVVEAEDSTIKTYSVNINRAAASQETGINSILINSNEVEIVDGVNEFNYTLAESVSNYVFSIIGKEPNLQKIEYQFEGSGGYITMPAGGNSGSPRTIAKDESVQINIRVTAEDTSQIENYTLIIARAPSTNNELSLVSIKEGATTNTLSPEGTVYTYTIGATGADVLTVTAEGALGENSTVTILDASENEVVDGIISIENILPGTYVFTIEVAPQDVHAPVGTYTLNIIKKSDEKELFEPVVKHTNNFDELIEGFSYNFSTFTYTLNISYELNDVVVNDIRIEFMGSIYSSLTSPSWANFTQGAPVSNQPTAYADISFNNSAQLVQINRDVYVTAQDGSVQRYNIKIYRAAADSDNTLSYLTVAGNSVDGFSPNTFIYNNPIILPGDTQSVNVYGEPNSENATVTYNDSSSGQIPLTRGELTTVNIKVLAQNGVTQTYTIKVIAANTENSISNIVLKDGQSQQISGLSFDPQNNGPYVINVPYPINVVTIEVSTPSGALSTVYGAGTHALTVSTNTFTVYSISEAGIKGEEYVINITRNAARTDKYLDTLTISSSGTNPVPNYIVDFNSSNSEYDIRVNRNVASLKVEATVPIDNGSRITSGLTDSYTWAGMSTTIQIEVTAEDNSKRVYKVNVTRANDVNEIVDIELDVQEINYSSAVTTYDLNPVAYATVTINFNVTLQDSFSSLYIKINSAAYILQNDPTSVIVTLNVGQNTINMYVVSEYGTQGSTYKFNIQRNVPSTNAKLDSLEIIAGGSNILVDDNAFDTNTPLYQVRVNNSITSITIDATLQDINASFSISPAGRTLNSGLNTFYITVTAEDNTTQLTYEVRITRANDIYDINDIEVDLETIDFDQATTNYLLNSVSYATDMAVFDVTLADSSAKLYVRVNSASKRLEENPESVAINLIQGLNTIRIYAESEYGTQGTTYVFTVTRNAPSTNANLADLEVIADSNNLLVGDKAFEVTTTLYELRVDNNIPSVIINATAQDNKATVAVTPANLNLSSGLNTFFVTVTAEDGVSKLVYELRITKANDINDINNIEVDLQTIVFGASTTSYSLDDVPFATDTAIFNVTLEDSSSKLYVKVNSGSASLQDSPESVEVSLIAGTNTIYIYAVSEYGTQGTTYVFTVTRNAASTNAKLGLLEILASGDNLLTGDNSFDSDVTLYEMRVDNDIASITINAEPADSKARLSITPTSRTLDSGQNNFYIKVTAEDNTSELTYTVKITRANDINDIENIEVDLQMITFEALTTTYSLDSVSYLVQTATFNVTLADSSANLYVKVNSGSNKLQNTPESVEVNLITGQNTISIYAVSEYGTQGVTYQFTITRNAPGTNARLSDLEIWAGENNLLVGENAFDSETILYKVRVDNNIESISINATPMDSNASVSITPSNFNLVNGINTYYITVTAEDTVTNKVYELRITKANDINDIENIEVDLQTISYDPSITEYALDSVISAIQTAIFNVSLTDASAKLYVKVNNGSRRLAEDPQSIEINLITGANTIRIQAESEYGTEGDIYVFTVTRFPASTNAKLSLLEIIADGNNVLIGENAFDPDIGLYNIRVDHDITDIIINAETADSQAKLSITPTSRTLELGLNNFYIKVTAEDNLTELEYTVKINRANDINEILDIEVNVEEIAFSQENYLYQLNAVAFSVKTITFNITLLDIYSKLYIKKNSSSAQQQHNPESSNVTLDAGQNNIQIYAVSENGIQGDVYTFTITQNAANNDTSLSSLEVIAYGNDLLTGDNSFDSETKEYNVRVNNNITAVTINAVANDSNANVSQSPSSGNLVSNSKNIFYINITAESGVTDTYTINVYRANDNNTILELRVNGVPIELVPYVPVILQDFHNSVQSINISATLEDSSATLYGTGSKTLVEGMQLFEIYAISQYGILTGQTKDHVPVYIIQATRKPLSNDNKLEGLIVTDMEDNIMPYDSGISFDPLRYAYQITLSDTSEITEVKINAVAQTNNKTVSGDIGKQNLTVYGDGTINSQFIITVRAENNSTQNYTINILKGTSLSNDASIDSVTLKDSQENEYLTFNPAIAKQQDVNIPYNISGLTLMVKPNHTHASVSGTYGYINVNAGSSVYVEFKVIAQDGTESLVYNFSIIRAVANTENHLEFLTIKDENDLNVDFLDGVFNAGITTYDVRVDDIVESVVINASVPENNGSFIINSILPSYFLVSGETRTVFIMVQAENGSTNIYTINIKRANNDNSIASIKIGEIVVPVDDFTYVANSYEYNVSPNFIYGKNTVEIEAMLEDPGCKATITGNGVKNLSVGNNSFIVYATAQDGTVGDNYIIRIIREAASNDNSLQSLQITTNTAEVLLDEQSGIQNIYNLQANRAVTSVTINAVANHSGAIVNGDIGEVTLNGGTVNVLKIYVTAENNTVKTYTINLDIKDDDNEILDIAADLALINYQLENYIYDLGEVPFADDTIVFSFSLNNAYAKLYVNSALVSNLASSSHTLAEGVNTFIVYAESERGNVGQNYTITITRTEADSNNYLSSLSVSGGGNELPFIEGAFNKELEEYTVILDGASTISYIEITATAENGSQPQGTGIKQLKVVAGVISNIFVVSVTAENGNIRNYSITVIKSSSEEISDDNSISDISLIGNGQEYLKNDFNPEVSVQNAVTVPYNVGSVYLSITAHKDASITGAGMYNIDEGQTITIQFQVTAENGFAGMLYEVEVTREIASSNNTLDELYYEFEGDKTYIDPSIDEHTINIDYSVTNIIIGGLAPSNAIVAGFGDFTLASASTTKVITVTAQNGEVRTYVLTIVKQSDDSSIKSILRDSVNIIDDFVNYEYNTNFPYSKSSVSIIATPNNSNAVVYGNGTYNLNVGLNTIEIYAESEAGTMGQIYTINITRQEANTNNNLANLVVRDAANDDALLLQPAFSSSTTNYVIDVTDFPQVQEIKIEATAESAKAKSVTGTGTFILKTAAGESSEIFTVTVTAEDDSKKNYNITVIRNVNPDDDVTVHSLSFIGNDSINYFGTASSALQKFELSKKSYNIIVPYKVNNATLTVTNSNGANVYGNGNYVLTYQSDNIIEFYLDSKSGNYSSDMYVLVVTREQPSNVNTLSSLTVDGVLIEGFDPEILSYEIVVSYEDVNSVVIGATPTHQEANVIGDLGNINLSAGLNTINITVRAEDNSTKTYSITISRLSTDNTLIHLGVTNYTISPSFDKDIYEYTLNVPYPVEMVNIEAIASSTATITGAGHKSLQIGENTINVFATSEQGQAGQVYEIIINRAQPSTDNTLKDLSVLSGVDETPLALQPSFRPEILNYIIQLEDGSSINTLYIFAEANCPYAKGVGGTGYKVLTTTVDGQYNNVFEIIVMAQDDSTKVYTVSVYRNVELADDVTITEFSLIGSNGTNYLGGGSDALSKFSPNIYTYNIVVPYYVESITLAIQTLSASVYGAGQKMFNNDNRVTFNAYLVSQSGNVTSNIYTIHVNRIFASENNLLDFIKVNGQNIEDFDPNVMQYEIDIPYQTTNKIIISAEPKNSSAVILNGIGTFEIEEGRNVFSILVKAENGDTKSYNLVVNYLNNNSLLETLNIQASMEDYVDDNNYIAYPFTFIPDTFNYIVTVDKNIKTVVLKGSAHDQDRAAIIGLGKYTLNNDRTTITINVIAADNTTTSTYKVDIVKTVMPSTNTRLKDLQVGGYSLGFKPDNRSYVLTVGSNIEYLDISAIPEDPNATTTIIGNDYLDIGNNVILVQVESEDGSVSYYQLSVKKNIEQDYFLTVLLILIFLLMVLAFLYKIMSNNKNNTPKKKDFKKFKLNGNNDNELIDLNNIGKEAKKWQT